MGDGFRRGCAPASGKTVRSLTGRALGAKPQRPQDIKGVLWQVLAQAQVLAGHWCGVPCPSLHSGLQGSVGGHLRASSSSHKGQAGRFFPARIIGQKIGPRAGARGPEFNRLSVLALQPGVHVERDSLDLEVLEIGRVRVDAEELTEEDAYDLLVHVPLNQLH